MLPYDPIELQHELDANYYVTLISFTILVQEYICTFDQEVERYWSGSSFSWASFFFYLNRYVTLLGHIPVMLQFFWTTQSPAKLLVSYPPDISPIFRNSRSNFSVLLIMRMYALYEKSLRILSLFVSVALGAVGFGCWAVLAGKTQPKAVDIVIEIGCASSLTRYDSIRMAAAWGGLVIFDTLVFVMTLYRSCSFKSSSGLPLMSLLTRDGSMYFGVMVCSALGNIMTFLFGGPFTRGVLTIFTNVISSVAITRLMLHLRDPSLADRPKRHTDLTSIGCPDIGGISTIIFPQGQLETQNHTVTHGSTYTVYRGASFHGFQNKLRQQIQCRSDGIEYEVRGPGRPVGDSGYELLPVHSPPHTRTHFSQGP
ncbi:hypothetical protein BDN72DRAFT_194885 [Pluteus cervinus]|uniref:Uncharacterized protein n=1 Tax=Pluteus cervinus TaxID=181527 RepID=A0ACD3AIB0_9AGAR|nr:hypothetical protein BDN72DRAFT_194885 [Pluteus cervinus]